MKARKPVPTDQWKSCTDQYIAWHECCFSQNSCAGCSVPYCSGFGYIDLMSYEGNASYRRWINPKRWLSLFDSLRDLNSDPAHAVSCLTSECNSLQEPVVLISGSIGVNDQLLDPLYSADSVPDQPNNEILDGLLAAFD